MAKRHRSGRAEAHPRAIPPPDSREELTRRLEALRDDLASARAEAEARNAGLPPRVRPEPAPHYPSLQPPDRPPTRRRVLLFVAVLVALAVMALVAGLLATTPGSSAARRRRAAPPAAVAPPTTASAPAGVPGGPAAAGPGPGPVPIGGPVPGGRVAGAAVTATVQAGQSFWSIATAVVAARLGATPTVEQVGSYWAHLVAANAAGLRHPGDPDLIYPGQTVVVPSA